MSTYDLALDEMPTDLEHSSLDKERKDFLSKDDMLKIIQYYQEDQLPQKFKRTQELFFCSGGKSLGLSFLKDQDEAMMVNRFMFSSVMHRMESPRSEKTTEGYILENEMLLNLVANIRKSQGFGTQRTNLSTLFSTIVKHNVHTMTESGGGGGGIFAKAGRFFRSG